MCDQSSSKERRIRFGLKRKSHTFVCCLSRPNTAPAGRNPNHNRFMFWCVYRCTRARSVKSISPYLNYISPLYHLNNSSICSHDASYATELTLNFNVKSVIETYLGARSPSWSWSWIMLPRSNSRFSKKHLSKCNFWSPFPSRSRFFMTNFVKLKL